MEPGFHSSLRDFQDEIDLADLHVAVPSKPGDSVEDGDTSLRHRRFDPEVDHHCQLLGQIVVDALDYSLLKDHYSIYSIIYFNFLLSLDLKNF